MSNPPYHPESLRLIELASRAGGKPYHELSVQAARERSDQKYLVFQGNFEFPGSRKEIIVASDQVQDGISTFVYLPDDVDSDPPIYVYFHGGGFVLGSRHGVDGMCRQIATESRCVVVNVEYRLAPEHKFPAFMDDACCVVHWVTENKCLLGGSERSRVGVGGDSAGGSIAASVAHDCPQLDFCVLIYPHVVARNDYSLLSYKQYEDDPIINRDVIKWFVEHASGESDFSSPRLASILRPSFDKIPPTLFIVAQCDPLRDDSYAYRDVLSQAGVPTDLHLSVGALHAFYTMPGHYHELCAAAYGQTTAFIRRYGAVRH